MAGEKNAIAIHCTDNKVLAAIDFVSKLKYIEQRGLNRFEASNCSHSDGHFFNIRKSATYVKGPVADIIRNGIDTVYNKVNTI